MMPDDGVTTGSRRDLLIAQAIDDPESADRIRAAEERISGSSALLAEEAAALSLAFGVLSKASRLSPISTAKLTSLKIFAQAIVDEVDSVLAGTGPPAFEDKGLPSVEQNEAAPSARLDVRRRNSKTFDFLLLEALFLRPQAAHPIGLRDMDRIALAFDPTAKHGSLVAKLNRWKSTDGLLKWDDHEDMSLTLEGSERRMKLLPLAKKEGQLGRVQAAIDSVLGIKATY